MNDAAASSPKIRFPQFSDNWEEKRGGDAFTSRRERGKKGLPIYSVTIDRGMVRRDTLEREFTNGSDEEANLRAERDDIVYNMMRMWQGAAGRAPEHCMVSPAYVVLSPKSATSSHFFEYWFKRARSIYWLWAYSHGLTDDRLRLYFRDFERVPMRLPQLPEQRRIAEFLEAVSCRIDLLRQRRDALIRYKKGAMQQIFARTVRFARADGSTFPDWTPFKLGDVFEWVSTNNLSREMLVDEGGSIQNIHYGDIHGKFAVRFKQDEAKAPFIRRDAKISPFRDEAYCRPGDVIIADASEDYADVGKAIEIVEVRPRSLVSGLHTLIARPKEGMLAVGFAGYIFQTHRLRGQIMRIAQGISVLSVSRSSLSKLTIDVPHFDEQRKISDLLGALDDKIDALSAQVSAMQSFKTGLLQQMFV